MPISERDCVKSYAINIVDATGAVWHDDLMIGSKEAARRLGVSQTRVRQLIGTGDLAADRVGGRWIVSDESLRRLGERQRPDGRPFSPRIAWGVLFEISGIDPYWLNAPERSRIRRRVADHGWLGLAPRLRSRSVVNRMSSHRSVPTQLELDPRIVLGGMSAGLAGLFAAGQCEGYVREDEFPEIVDQYRLDLSESQANVVLRVVPFHEWRFEATQRVAPFAVVAFDLIDAGDARSIEAGLSILNS